MIRRFADRLTTRSLVAYAGAHRVARRAGSRRPGTAVANGARRRNVGEWTQALSDGHDRYRAEVEPCDEPVSIVCVTSRPARLGALLRAVGAQVHPVAQLILVANAAAYDAVDIDAVVAARSEHLPDVTVLRRSESVTLGECLNTAIDVVDQRFAAKFDDDDLYGPEYLSDSMRAHSYAGSGVVGKHTYYAYLEPQDATYLRFPGHEFTYTATVAGGTLVIDLGRTRSIRFPATNLGEDREFIRSCLRSGVSTFSADRFGFGQTRSHDNTWTPPVDRFLAASVLVGSGRADSEIGL